MKKLIAMTALVAFACAANASFPTSGSIEDKPKVECAKCKECKEGCECKCHKKKDEHKDHNH